MEKNEDDLNYLLGGKTDPETKKFDQPKQLHVKYILFQNQLWVNRRSILQYLDSEIQRVHDNHIPNINNYWDQSKIEYLETLRKFFTDLDPSKESAKNTDKPEEDLGE